MYPDIGVGQLVAEVVDVAEVVAEVAVVVEQIGGLCCPLHTPNADWQPWDVEQ